MKMMYVICVGVFICGCVAERPPSEFESYLSNIKILAKEVGNDFGCSETHYESQRDYLVKYCDDTYMSYWTKEWFYAGGAHGNATIKVGTFERKTGRQLTLDDVFPVADREALTKQLYDAVVKKIGGKDALQGAVKPVENFYLDQDGWHFVYQEYEVACYAVGHVEVVIPRHDEEQRRMKGCKIFSLPRQ